MSNDVPDWQAVAAQGQTLLGTITTTGDGLLHSQTFALPSPSTTQAIGLRAWNTGGFFFPSQTTITGDVSGTLYVVLQSSTAVAGSDVERWFLPDANAICAVTDQGVGKPAKVDFLALNFGPVVTIRTGNTGPPIEVEYTTNGPRAWLSPGLLPIDVTSALAAGASQTVVAAVASIPVRVFTLQGTFDSTEAAVDYAVQDGSTTRGRLSLVSVGPHFQDWHGVALTPGQALVLKNEGANTHVLRGTAIASQAAQ